MRSDSAARPDPGLPLTGERTVPGVPEENYWFRRHEVVYRALAPRCAGGVVLEAGCGEGYGADLLAA
ncbi:MAG TPA: SAM-dependent methyltransferase, partial [Pseudonocardia sp.]|nr:SAM-dependent methyltransferase [Pseudonocardia sp.]